MKRRVFQTSSLLCENKGNNMGKYKHLSWNERLQIEALWKAKHTVQEIATQIGVHQSTIYRELKRGKTVKRRSCDWAEIKVYSPDLAQMRADENKKEKGRPLKVGNDLEFMRFVEKKIIEDRYSPAAVLSLIEKENLKFDTQICLTTLYNYIKKDLFLNVTMGDCPYHKTCKKQKKKRVQKRKNAGVSIERRPEEIEYRNEVGHWEMDTVVGAQGKSKHSFLVLTERKTRYELIEILKEHTAKEVVRILDKLERKFTEKGFRKLFKSITVDNGTEFSDYEGLRRSRRNKKERTHIYYCHAYSSWERGTNENNNKFVRRWHPKGTILDDVKLIDIKKIQDWMNNYPRMIFKGESSLERIRSEPDAALLLGCE